MTRSFSNLDSIFSAIISTPFGGMGIRTQHGAVRELVYLPRSFPEKAATDALAEKTANQILRYVADPDFSFDLPLEPIGTVFQSKVWKAISAIPRGEVQTYGQLARAIGSAPRAIGQACGANPYPLIVPCHRVTASGGIGGFSNDDDERGFYLGIKRWLLAHEGVTAYVQV